MSVNRQVEARPRRTTLSASKFAGASGISPFQSREDTWREVGLDDRLYALIRYPRSLKENLSFQRPNSRFGLRNGALRMKPLRAMVPLPPTLFSQINMAHSPKVYCALVDKSVDVPTKRFVHKEYRWLSGIPDGLIYDSASGTIFVDGIHC